MRINKYSSYYHTRVQYKVADTWYIKQRKFTDVFFTSDLHFNDRDLAKSRGFSSVDDMNETMIDNWNSTVDDSIIFVLGDFCHKGIEGILKRLNGYIILVLGNHDMEFVEEYKRLGVPIFQNYQLKVQEKDLWLSHYAHRVWHKSSVGSWHLYGHTHGQLEEVGLSFDVCTELYMYKPVSINQVESKMRLKLA